ncbi:tyrosine-type recombinase/integrase [Halomarina oriensis]|uniref:Recombinase XerD n=1 Tax=Halomarina oriensis TaxID=671145 RepID=A0A6B0GWT4_9EURY|nr:recombinase XerD [Halomarina oriensis]MWG36218.1 recombinase XerD [Halomarina oriensis]
MEPTETAVTPGDDGQQTSLQIAAERYLRSKSTGRDDDGDPTGAYVDAAGSELRRFIGWMHARGRDLDDLAGDDGPLVMRRYAERLDDRVTAGGIAGSTANSYFSYLSGFLTYCVRDDRLPTNPALTNAAQEALPAGESSRTDQQFWTTEQRRQLVGYVDHRAAEAVDEKGFDATTEARDRALVRVLAYSAVRGAEVLRHPKDDREGRQGLRWGDVDLEGQTMRILGKDLHLGPAALPQKSAVGLERWQAVQRPVSEDWPVFPTGHAPSKYDAVRTVLGDDVDVANLASEAGGIDSLLRERDLAPPSLTTEGARTVMKRLTTEAGIEVEDRAGYLQLHGARRGIVGEVYRRDRGDAQDLARHKDLSTTHAAYQHIDVEEQTERFDDHLSNID